MNISINIREQQKNVTMPGITGPSSAAKKEGEQRNALFAGDMNLAQDPIRERLENARKKAYKIVSDAFGVDQDFDLQMDKVKDFAREQREEKYAAATDKRAAEDTISALKEEYHVDPDSKEQQDLDWLMAYRKASPDERFADLEQMKKDQARAAEIEAGLSDYQAAMLEANERLDHAQGRMEEADAALIATRQALTDAKTEKNKSHAMVDAQKEADEIMDEAERAVVGMVMSDAKDKLDEKLREEQEKAEEKKEEEEKQEKIEEQREEKKEIQEALTEGSREAVQEAKERGRQREGDDFDLTDVMGSDPTVMLEKTSNVNAQLDDLKNKMALIDADLKGLKVDETV